MLRGASVAGDAVLAQPEPERECAVTQRRQNQRQASCAEGRQRDAGRGAPAVFFAGATRCYRTNRQRICAAQERQRVRVVNRLR